MVMLMVLIRELHAETHLVVGFDLEVELMQLLWGILRSTGLPRSVALLYTVALELAVAPIETLLKILELQEVAVATLSGVSQEAWALRIKIRPL